MEAPNGFNLSQISEVVKLSGSNLEGLSSFNCDDRHVNKFFKKKALPGQEQLLSRSYMLQEKRTGKVIGAYCISADSVNTLLLSPADQTNFKNQFPRGKGFSTYPAIKIDQLGVDTSFQHKGYFVGSQVLNNIKAQCLLYNDNVGCRYLVLDSYNTQRNLRFYQQNGFKCLFEEESEKQLLREENLSTRFMYYDLRSIISSDSELYEILNSPITNRVILEESSSRDGSKLETTIITDSNKGEKLSGLEGIYCIDYEVQENETVICYNGFSSEYKIIINKEG